MFEYFISNLIYKVICSNQPSSFFEIQVYCFQSRWVSILDRIVSFSLFKKTIHLDKMETRIPQNQGSLASTNIEYSPYSERTTEIIELYFKYIYTLNLFNILEGKRIWGKLIKSVPFKDKNSCCNCIDFYFEYWYWKKISIYSTFILLYTIITQLSILVTISNLIKSILPPIFYFSK